MPSQNYIPCSELPSFLGVSPGECLWLASDITRLAWTTTRNEGEFDPNTLIDSFLNILGPEGTLVIPSFNFNLKSGDLFDVQASVPVTGILAETALKRKDFFRTRHPLHSFLVSGKYAVHLSGMNNTSSFGEDSPFAFLNQKNALAILIGTTVTDAFTFVHYVEEMEKVKYRRYKTIRLNYVSADNKSVEKEFKLFAKKPGWTMNLSLLEELFRNKGVLQEMVFNGVICSKIRLGDAYPIIRDDILNEHARHISRFSIGLLAREILKKSLSSLHLYKTISDKISHDPGPR